MEEILAEEDKDRRYKRLVTAADVAAGRRRMTRNTRYYVGESSFDAVMAFLVKDLAKATRDIRLQEDSEGPFFNGLSEEGIGLVKGRYAIPEMY